MSARWWTVVVWAAAAASALYWGLKLFVRPLPVPPQVQIAAPSGGLRGDLSRLLGADLAPVAVPVAAAPVRADPRFQLVGVVAPRAAHAAREGVAVIVVDGKPPRAYRVGAIVDGEQVLQAVHPRGAALGPRGGAAMVSLQLAPPAPPATGTPGAAALAGGVPGGPRPLSMPNRAPIGPGDAPQPPVADAPMPPAEPSGPAGAPAEPD